MGCTFSPTSTIRPHTSHNIVLLIRHTNPSHSSQKIHHRSHKFLIPFIHSLIITLLLLFSLSPSSEAPNRAMYLWSRDLNTRASHGRVSGSDPPAESRSSLSLRSAHAGGKEGDRVADWPDRIFSILRCTRAATSVGTRVRACVGVTSRRKRTIDR